MKIAIHTPLEGFTNDIADVIRLFYGEGSVVTPLDEHDAELVHEHEESGGVWRERVTLKCDGKEAVQELAGDAVAEEGLERKRRLKRLIKRCCYQLMKLHTGRHPAWGSLTGIRPTRLYYQQMEQGKTRNEARRALAELFDLTDEKIELLDEIIDAQSGLIAREPDACDLYVGIPFCTTRCAYCSFSSGEIGNGKLVEPYLQAL